MDKQNIITATIFLYSGRPNPVWKMPEKEYNKLLLLIQKLTPTKGEHDFLLGYSGVMLSTDSNNLHAFNGLIVVNEKGIHKSYTDTNRTIEARILRQAPPAFLEEIKQLLPKTLL